MNIKCVQSEKEYIRIIEAMGEGLVLFKVCVPNKRVGQNIHLFFENKRKPPLDLAINPELGTIEYISYFAQDEKIVERTIINEIEYNGGLITLEEDSYKKMNNNINIEKAFEIVKSCNDIYILSTDTEDQPLQAFQINNFNYLLLLNNNDFCGIVLKGISKRELNEIKNSRCI